MPRFLRREAFTMELESCGREEVVSGISGAICLLMPIVVDCTLLAQRALLIRVLTGPLNPKPTATRTARYAPARTGRGTAENQPPNQWRWPAASRIKPSCSSCARREVHKC